MGVKIPNTQVNEADPVFLVDPATGLPASGGGGSSGPTATAAADGTVVVVAGTSKPQAIDLFSSTSVIVKDSTGAPVDWTAAVPVTQSGTWTIAGLSGTVSLPTGAATEASLVKIPLTQGSTTSGQSGALIQGAVTTAAPSYTTAQTSPLSLTTGGALRVDVGSAGFTSTGPTADDAAATGNPVQVAGKYTSTIPTFADGDTAQLRLTTKGGLWVAGDTADDAPAPSAANTYPTVTGGLYLASTPTYTTGDRVQTQFDQRGNQRVSIWGPNSNTPSVVQGSTDGATFPGQSVVYTFSIPGLYNGTSYDRGRNITGSYGAGVTGVAAVEQAGSPISHITTATSTQVKTGAGIIHGILVGTPIASATIGISDATAGTASDMGLLTLPSVITGYAPTFIPLHAQFTTGLRITTSAATDITVVYR